MTKNKKTQIIIAICLMTCIWFIAQYKSEASYTGQISAKVYGYLNTPTNTTITTGGNFYPVAGAFSNPTLDGWSFVTDHIEYDLNKTRRFLIGWSASLSTDASSATVSIAIKKNTTVRDAQKMSLFCKDAGELYSFSGIDMVECSNGDEIQIVTTSDSDGDVVTFSNLTTSLVNVDGN